MLRTQLARSAALSVLLAMTACTSSPAPDDHVTGDAADGLSTDTAPDSAPGDVQRGDVTQPDGAVGPEWCSVGTPVAQAHVPEGFCLRLFAGTADGNPRHSPVVEPRVMTFAPNGDLFVSAPSTPAAGGASGGPGAILALSDDNRDGTAEAHVFLDGVADVHGVAFGPDALYFTTTDQVLRTPYALGQRAATQSGGRATTTEVSAIPTPGRWTHGLARSTSGAMYYSNGVLVGACPSTNVGSVNQVNPGAAPTQLAGGLRNPMSVRCHFRDDVCYATEMGDDAGASYGAREKLFRIHAGTNYGFPCCAGPGMPVSSGTNCDSVTMEEAAFTLNTSPFGFDWERGYWPPPIQGVLCVALHGSFYSTPPWQGEGVLCAPTDPGTHAPAGPFAPFVQGFSPTNAGTGRMERPADIAFSPDGRMFVADDIGDAIYWVAPLGLRMPAQ